MTHADFMRRAIELAKKGAGFTSPNPMVGAVAVKNGRIIAEDYHHRCGEYHAERNALLNCREDCCGADLYVTLEPCCHYGKTPPCTEIIIEKGIKRVFIGSRDPNPKVAGKGAAILREHGIEVIEDFMREACDEINPAFLHFITDKDPYVVMKYAMTLDGKIATKTGASRWITGEKAREHVHKLRSEYASIMAGIGTVLKDDPMLNARIENAHQPVRIICDSRLRLPLESKIAKTAGEYKTIAVCAMSEADFSKNEKREELEKCGIEVWNLPGEAATANEGTENENGSEACRVDLRALMHRLGQEGIASVLIEGGGTLHFEALKAGIVNHVCAYIAPKLFGGREAKTPVEGSGIAVPDEAFKLKNQKITQLGDDLLLEYDMLYE